jgi:hypothetical protein
MYYDDMWIEDKQENTQLIESNHYLGNIFGTWVNLTIIIFYLSMCRIVFKFVANDLTHKVKRMRHTFKKNERRHK